MHYVNAEPLLLRLLREYDLERVYLFSGTAPPKGDRSITE